MLIGLGADWGLEQRQFGINQEFFVRKCPISLLVISAHDPAKKALAAPGRFKRSAGRPASHDSPTPTPTPAPIGSASPDRA